MKILKNQNGEGSDVFMLEEEEGMILLTRPVVIERSEVLIITPTELVVKELDTGSSESR